VLIARFLKGKISAKEEVELDLWINKETGNYELFHRLTLPESRQEAAKWLATNGVNPRFLKKPFEYYRRPYDPKELRNFYFYAALAFLWMLVLFFVSRFS